jgi:hypothetical protein
VLHAIFTIDFDIEHRQRLVQGTPEQPKLVIGRWRKVAGTRFISWLEGSFVLRRIDDQLTEVELIEHCSAARTGIPEMQLFLGDLFAGAVALAHGRALPPDYSQALGSEQP